MRVSPSQLDLLAKCGQAWKFRYIDGLKIPPVARMIVGTGVDVSINANLGHKIETDSLLPEEAVLDAARDGVENDIDSRGLTLDEEGAELGAAKVKDQIVDRAVALAGKHHRDVAPGLEPTHVQRHLDIELAGYDCNMVGILDIQEGTKAVRDTKTTRKSPDKNAADESTALTFYALGVQVVDGVAPAEVSLDYLIDKSHLKTPKPPEVRRITSKRDASDWQPLLNRVESAIKVIESGIVQPAPPGSWWCSKNWCGYWNICPFVNSARSK